MARDEVGTLARLKACRAIIDGLIASHRGRIFNTLKFRSMIVRLDGDLAGEFATKMTIDQISLGTGGGFVSKLVRGAFSKVPLKLNLNINGPFRALIQMAKAFKEPRQAITPVMPFPIDSPSLDVVVVQSSKQEEQTATTPTNDVEVNPKTNPPSPNPSEK